MLPTNVKPQTISAVTAQIKAMLEPGFPSVWVAGEVCSVTIPGSGHVYFTLKDKQAQLPAVMWRSTAQRNRYAIKDGAQVVVHGSISVYPPHGKYQLTVDQLFETGVGAADLALRRVKEKLHKLGYFAPEHKKPLPSFPRRIALVTSRSGAAIRDMLEIITRRWPCAEIWVCGVRVQGPEAVKDIILTLNGLNRFAGIDVILLGRGGGSGEDLAAFNDEFVAEAIFKSRIPIVSAVGHEIDVTIADMVADKRAATPSEAAEIATPDRAKWLQTIVSHKQRLQQLLMNRFQANQQRLQSLMQRRIFRFPLELLRNQERRLDDFDERLQKTIAARLEKDRRRLDALTGRLESLSPLNVLARGYSLTRTTPGKHVVRSVKQVDVGDTVEIIVSDGTLQAEVQSMKPRES
jgi:exodeoxyribonuclease VII large subunit